MKIIDRIVGMINDTKSFTGFNFSDVSATVV